jgi:heme exporter protein D
VAKLVTWWAVVMTVVRIVVRTVVIVDGRK